MRPHFFASTLSLFILPFLHSTAWGDLPLSSLEKAKQFLGALGPVYVAAKELSCKASKNKELKEADLRQALARDRANLTRFELNSYGLISGDVTLPNGEKVRFSISDDDGSISIEEGGRKLFSESFSPQRCLFGFLQRYYYTSDSRELKIERLTENGVQTTNINTPPKSIAEIYNCNGYDGKTFEELEAIARDATRVSSTSGLAEKFR